jgi:translation initiation factor IF-3
VRRPPDKDRSRDRSRQIRINVEIKAPEVRVISQDGEQIGIMSPSKALILADEAGLDLVEVAPDGKPPVCRIMDFGKYMYELRRKERSARKKQHVIKIKGIRLTPNIDSHDFNFKNQDARKFIEQGQKVRVWVQFKGRSITHREIGMEVLNRFAEELSDVAKIEAPPKMEGPRNLVMLLTKK